MAQARRQSVRLGASKTPVPAGGRGRPGGGPEALDRPLPLFCSAPRRLHAKANPGMPESCSHVPTTMLWCWTRTEGGSAKKGQVHMGSSRRAGPPMRKGFEPACPPSKCTASCSLCLQGMGACCCYCPCCYCQPLLLLPALLVTVAIRLQACSSCCSCTAYAPRGHPLSGGTGCPQSPRICFIHSRDCA